ncbi:MAG: hypothetical protein VKJ02_10460 [Snowella sp.]|nr:hypothetical protein [Snowella sp.]
MKKISWWKRIWQKIKAFCKKIFQRQPPPAPPPIDPPIPPIGPFPIDPPPTDPPIFSELYLKNFFSKVYFKNPDKKIYSLQIKTLEILFSRFNLSVKEYDFYVAYFPSRLLNYLYQQDAFSAFKNFLNDIGTTPEEVFGDEKIANFAREAILGLYEADMNCWDTSLNIEPLYQSLRSDFNRNLIKFKNLLRRIEKFTTIFHKLKRASEKITFPAFNRFIKDINIYFDSWDTMSQVDENILRWTNLISDYETAFKLYQDYLYQIENEISRLERIEITSQQKNIVDALLKEVSEAENNLISGITEIAEGLEKLENLLYEIKSFVDEVLHRTRDRRKSRKDDFASKDDKLSVEDALILLNLTLEELSIQSLKQAFRQQANIHHPDKLGGSEEMMKKINEANEKLKEYLEARST